MPRYTHIVAYSVSYEALSGMTEFLYEKMYPNQRFINLQKLYNIGVLELLVQLF